jgi:hypothetical protein
MDGGRSAESNYYRMYFKMAISKGMYWTVNQLKKGVKTRQINPPTKKTPANKENTRQSENNSKNNIKFIVAAMSIVTIVF